MSLHPEKSTRIESMGFGLFCRLQSQYCLKSIAQIKYANIHECETQDEKLNDSKWLSVIFVAAGGVRLTFKVQFDEREVDHHVTSAYGEFRRGPERERAMDFIKEFCNISAGAIKKTFHTTGYKSQTSLPFVTRGLDNLFFKPHDGSPYYFEDCWALEGAGGRLNCSVVIESISKDDLTAVFQSRAFESTSTEGDVEFFEV